MDTLYIGDIPQEYCYAQWGNDYVTLYNTNNFTNGNYDYYRIYYNAPGFFYSKGSTNITNNYTNITTQKVNVSDDWLYRKDIGSIFTVSFIIILLFIFVFNIATSVFRKGGIFGGLL